MSTVRVYKSTDPGAPAHPSDLRGSMAALLRACLVVGYGSGEDAKAPAGWEEPYPETGNYACFRALSGERQFYQVNDNNLSANVSVLTSYDSMSDAATGTGNRGSEYFGKRPSTISGTYWAVIADEKTCYVLLNSQFGMAPHVFGEYYSYLAGDPYKGILSGHSSNSNMVTAANAGLSSGQLAGGPILHRTYYGVLTEGRRIRTGGPPSSLDKTDCINGTSFTLPALAGLSYPVYPALLQQITVTYGKLRGVYYPGAYKPRADKEIFTFDGMTMQAFDLGGSTNTTALMGQIWFDITGSWEEST
ncbi:MAG: hypothetical protein AB7E55_00920 [Pigmentiphaga sp.]